ncbi:MAG: class I SAM-dependent methyltransferase, partial [Chloroflexota bacterium]
MTNQFSAYHEANRKSWNAATAQHHTHKLGLIEQYRGGHNNLFPEDMALLDDAAGKSLVHLQCNDGQDTLSIAKHAHANVLGVDISDTAVGAAKALAAGAGIPATFVRSDIFDWFEQNETRYDLVYTSYGAINWIADIKTWGAGVAQTLKPGGKFVMIEFHPTLMIFDFEHDWSAKYDGIGGKPIPLEGVGDYVGNDFEGAYQNPHPSWEFVWAVGEVTDALLSAGLAITHLREHPYINGWQASQDMRPIEGSRYIVPEHMPTIPLMYSIAATKP